MKTFLRFIAFFAMLFFAHHAKAQCACQDCPNGTYEVDPNGGVMTIISEIEVVTTGTDDLGANPLQSVCIDLYHTWLGDVSISLESPDGVHYAIIGDGTNAPGSGCEDTSQGIDVCIQQGNTNPLTDGTPYSENCNGNGIDESCLVGDWTMACGLGAEGFVNGATPAPNCDLHDFNIAGNSVSGTWTLRVQCVCNIEPGELIDWSLSFLDNSVLDCPDPVDPGDCTLNFEETIFTGETGTICLDAPFDFENNCPDDLENVSITADGLCLIYTGNIVGSDIFCFEVMIDGEICSVTVLINVLPVPALVYPGDMNVDGFTDMLDFLYIGLAYGSSGPIRPDASMNWVGQECENWEEQTPFTETNYKYIDANGDGTINMNDVASLETNWGNTADVSSPPQLITIVPVNPMVLSIENQQLISGEYVSIPIHFSNPTEATEIYSLAFRVHLDETIFDLNTADFFATDSWLGESEDLIHFNHLDGENLHIGISRTDSNNQFGEGNIGVLVIKVRDDAVVGSESAIALTSYVVLNASEFNYNVETQDAIVEIITSIEETWATTIQLFPNPASSNLTISHPNSTLESISIFDANGRLVQKLQASGLSTLFSTEELNNGVYLLQLQNGTSTVTRRVVILH